MTMPVKPARFEIQELTLPHTALWEKISPKFILNLIFAQAFINIVLHHRLYAFPQRLYYL